jgi:hypothetical protein
MGVKVLVLILASDTDKLYVDFQSIWRKYMHSHPDMDCYFYKANPNLDSEYKLQGDTLWVRAKESRPTIYEKTLKAFEYFAKTIHKYDFVFRPNLSSFVVFDKYLQHCQFFPKTGLVAAYVGHHNIDKTPFPSGSGYTMSSDVVLKLLQERPALYNDEDDLTIGKWLYEKKTPILPVPRCDFDDDSCVPQFRDGTEENTFHYRIRNNTRRLDLEIHKNLLKKFYQ